MSFDKYDRLVDLPTFERAANVRASSFNEADNTVQVIWTTGAGVRRYSYREECYYQEVLEVTPEAVRLDRLNAGAPFLNTHADDTLAQVIGAVVPGTATVTGGRGFATIRLSRAAVDSDIIEKIRDGIIRNISVGYAIHEVQRSAGAEGADEVWRVVDWEPLEISAVPVPADAGSQIRSTPRLMVPCRFVPGRAIGAVEAARRRMVMRAAAVGVFE